MDNESTLEAILVNQNQKADETINALETIIAQNEENKIDTILEAQLLTQKELLEKLPEKQNISIQVEGVEVASIEGAKGDKGEQGEAGKTPVKGVDYFTDEDVQEITEKAVANGVATLGAGGILVPAQTPDDDTISAYQTFGSSIKVQTIGMRINDIISSVTFTDNNIQLVAVYIKRPMTITGVQWFQVVQGDYTADNYNGVGLFSVSGGTLTLVASSTNDGNIWKGAANTWQTKAFSSTFAATTGVYYVGMLYNNSAQTTAPSIGCFSSVISNVVPGVNFSNSHRLVAAIAAQNTFAASYNASASFSFSSVQRYIALY